MPLNIIFFFLVFISSSVFAQIPLNNALSFAPPPSDRSMVFLAEIFGNVDGVLAGTGSQMFGHLMEVFNSTVLALGSIVVMYAIIGGTLNTAQEGEFLGKQWSSIWLPVRSVVGVSILAPKTSGFSVIQILVMWIIVQGVGAADKVWNATLDYLNRGGAIIQLQQSSTKISSGSGANPVYRGAVAMLAGQVCMKGLQLMIEDQRKRFLDMKSNGAGPCVENSSMDPNWKSFCNTPVPDFIGNFDAVSAQTQQSPNNGLITQSSDNIVVRLPDFPNSTIPFYTNLKGKCGQIAWKTVNASQSGASNLGLDVYQANNFKMSRAIAVQQMYNFLLPVALTMVNNSPAITLDPKFNANNCAHQSLVLTEGTNTSVCYARQQFGVAINSVGQICTSQASGCQSWSAVPGSNQSGSLLSGTEFSAAMASYQGLMQPVLSLINEMSNAGSAILARKFISESKQDGWILAGSYFFNLVALTQSKVNNPVSIDSNSGLEASKNFENISTNCSNTAINDLCWLFMTNDDTSKTNLNKLQRLNVMINGAGDTGGFCLTDGQPNKLYFGSFNQNSGYIQSNDALKTISCSSTVLGYIGNSYFLNVAGDSGAGPPPLDLSLSENLQVNIQPTNLGWPNFDCGGFLCAGKIVGGLIWTIFWAINYVVSWILSVVVNALIDSLIIYPIKSIIFPVLNTAYTIVNEPSHNPIVNLANMGGAMIQATVQGYFYMMSTSLIGATPFIGGIFMLIVAFALPLYAAWLSLFLSIGFSTAFFVPLVPYLTFTFGGIGWLFAVIEAMVAAPILALGIMSIEGEGLTGKSEQGFLLIVNVFLRPAMMIIGFMLGISLSYVSVWVMQAGFSRSAGFLIDQTWNVVEGIGVSKWDIFTAIFAKGFYVFIYVSIYTLLVQKSFTMIYILPDKIMRWIGGSAETYGSETAQWMEETKGKAEKFAQSTDKAMGAGFQGFQKGVGQVVDDVKKLASGGKGGQGVTGAQGKTGGQGGAQPGGGATQAGAVPPGAPPQAMAAGAAASAAAGTSGARGEDGEDGKDGKDGASGGSSSSSGSGLKSDSAE